MQGQLVEPVGPTTTLQPGLQTSLLNVVYANENLLLIGAAIVGGVVLLALCGLLLYELIAAWTRRAASIQQVQQEQQTEVSSSALGVGQNETFSKKYNSIKNTHRDACCGDIESPVKKNLEQAVFYGVRTISNDSTAVLYGIAEGRMDMLERERPIGLPQLPSMDTVRRAPSLRRRKPSLTASTRDTVGSATCCSSTGDSVSGTSGTFQHAQQVEVDESVRLRDIEAFGWASNPFVVRTTCLEADALPFISMVPNPRTLIKQTNDAGSSDFTLTTMVTEDKGANTIPCTKNDLGIESCGFIKHDYDAKQDEGHQYVQPVLVSANSIKPRDVAGIQDVNQVDQVNLVNAAPMEEASQQQVTKIHGTVIVLSLRQFHEEVRLLKLIGAGGAGCVHEAYWRGKRVAVKILHPSRQTSPSAVAAFRKEVEIMASVGSHPGVVSVLAACLDPPNMAIIAELAEGGSLAAVLHDGGVRPRYGTLLQIAEDVAVAVAHCHSLRLVHRDLKTHNILLGADGKPKVADFGLAATRQRTFLTVEPGALGTASVMAPEQFAAQEVTERCDSYAFGCLLWEMLTGKACWEEMSNVMQIIMAVGCERRRPPLPSGCPPELARLIRECWRHNASLRPGFPEIVDRLRFMRKQDALNAAINAVRASDGGASSKRKRFNLLSQVLEDGKMVKKDANILRADGHQSSVALTS